MKQLSSFERWWLNAWPHRMHIRQYVPKFLQACPQPFRGEVLEVGAGRGWTSRRILDTFPQVDLVATDVDEAVVDRFSSLQNAYGRRLTVRQADIMALPFDRESFDIVLAVHVMHQVADVPAAVQQLMRVLRPGGLLGVADENQHYVVGPVRWLWRTSNRLGKRDVLAAIGQEAQVLVDEGDVHYYTWAQKSYPV